MRTKTVSLAIVITVAITAITPMLVQPAFVSGGNCSGCAFSFTPKTLSSSLSGTGEHGVQKIFAPGQEASVSGGSASGFAPGQIKP